MSSPIFSLDDPISTEVRDIVKNICTTECKIAGNAAVEYILSGRTEFTDAEGGEFLDANAAIAVLVAIIPLIRELIKLRQEFQSAISDNDAAKLRERIGELETKMNQLRPQKRKQIVKKIFPEHKD